MVEKITPYLVLALGGAVLYIVSGMEQNRIPLNVGVALVLALCIAYVILMLISKIAEEAEGR